MANSTEATGLWGYCGLLPLLVVGNDGMENNMNTHIGDTKGSSP